MLTIGVNIDEQRIDGNLDRLGEDLLYIHERQFEAVELPVQGLDVVRHGKIDQRSAREVFSVLADFPFRYSVHAPHSLNLMDSRDRPTHIAVLRASLEFAAQINASVLVYHPGRYLPEELFFLGKALRRTEHRQKYLRDMEAAVIKRVSEEFPDILICMENLPPLLFHSPYCYAESLESLAEQIRLIDRPNVRMAVDFGHLFLASRFYDFDAVESLREAASLIGHTHVHDNFGIPTYYSETEQSRLIPLGRGDCHMPVGWGEVPVKAFLDAFVRDYEGVLLIETGRRYLDRASESRAALGPICDSIICATMQEGGTEERVA